MPLEILSFPMPVWSTEAPDPEQGRDNLCCPVCGGDLSVHQPDAHAPSRLLASCECDECAIWLALVFTPDHGCVYMVRVPSSAELLEALSARGELDSSCDRRDDSQVDGVL